ncbi:mannose-1-phosphate guanylyltransferase [Limibacter armeniacum]|uniref:mannose-1-phosphate guanylyltransferase n=1 Tax=Limibacter armeniacum TaxID=466084 RepID=UPI002FE66C27
MENNYVVIMAGGIGSRFWPFSRQHFPKQFQDILGVGKTMIQQTVERFDGICPPENIYIVTSEDYLELVKAQLPFLRDEQILLEPVRRNTAPCIAYACYKIASKDPDANIVVSPADHVILDVPEFKRVVSGVLETTKYNDILVTLGIRPNRPDTGYGYIQVQEDSKPIGPLKKVKTFTEKPNLELAVAFVTSGDFVWNAGIFIWNAKTILNEFKKHLPDISEAFTELNDTYYTERERKALKEAYFQCRNISIDYGIMEHADNVYVMRSDFGWSDLGTWKSLYEQADKNRDENVLQGNVMTYETRECIVKTPKDRLVVVQGLQNYIVAEYDNVLLICEKEQEQRIKQFVDDVKEKQGKDFV